MPKHIGRRSLRILGMLSLAACSAQGDGVSGPRVEAGDASWVQAGSADAGDRIAAPDGGFIAPIGGDSAVGPPGVVVTDSGSRPAQGPNVCASVRVAANRITPRVMLLIDGSGSMAEPLGDVSRWGALRTALLGPAGVVRELEGIVEFGMTVYSTPIPMRGAPLGMCPSLLSVPPALNNLESIAATFPQRPSGGFTPTGEALQGVVDALSAPSAAPSRGETLIVLATDGEPNGCDALQTLPLQALLDGLVPVNYGPSETAVSAAQSKNIDTYVVSLAPELIRKAQSRQHLQTLANLGQGLDRAASAGAEVFSPQDPAQLEMTLRSLVGSVVTCELGLEGKLVID